MSDWKLICRLEDIPPLGARVAQYPGGDIAVSRTAGDEVFALHDKCPHRGVPGSEGMVHGRRVTCPLHGWNIRLESGAAAAPDVGSCARFAVRVEGGDIYLQV